MTAIRSTRTARTEGITAKPAFRGRRAIVAAVAAVFGLLAAPLQAEHEAFNVTMTLTATVAAHVDGEQVTMKASMANAPAVDPRRQFGIQYREWDGNAGPDDVSWQNVSALNEASVTWELYLEDMMGPGPFYYQVRGWNMQKVDGEWQASFSEPSDTVTVRRLD